MHQRMRRALGHPLIVGVTCLAVVLAAVVQITVLYERADDRMRSNQLLLLAEAETYRQAEAAWHAIADGVVSSGVRADIREARSEAHRHLSEARRLDPEGGSTPLIRRLATFDRAIERDLDRSGLVAAQPISDHTHEARDRLARDLRATEQRKAHEATEMEEQADVASSVLLLSALLLIAALLWRCARERDRTSALKREAQLADVEERALRESERRFRALAQNASDSVTVVDAGGVITFQSESVERLLGYRAEALMGTRIARLAHPDHAHVLENVTDGPGEEPLECVLRGRDGRPVTVEILVADLREDAAIAGFVLTARDITERRRLEDQLRHRASHDGLTGLPNRALFEEKVEAALCRAATEREPVAILYIDLDGFKAINDSFGHDVGDACLVALAERLRGVLRAEDLVARLGGDEFAVLLQPAGNPERVEALIASALESALEAGEHSCSLRAAIGVATSEDGRESFGELLRSADLAMYSAKRGDRCEPSSTKVRLQA